MKTSTFFLLFATMATLVLALAVSCNAKPKFEFSPTFDSDDVPETQLLPVPGQIRGERSAGRRHKVHVVERETVSDDNPCKVQCLVDFFACKSLALFNKESFVAPTAADIKAFREEVKNCRDAKQGCFGGCSRFDA